MSGLVCADHFPKNCVVLDLETTGLAPDLGDRIIEAAAVRVIDGCLGDAFQSLVNPGIPVPDRTLELTGISAEDLKQAPRAFDVLPQFLDFVGDSPLIAHHAAVEHRFLDAECSGVGMAPPINSYFCTLRQSRQQIPNAPNYKLATLARFLRLPYEGPFHRALTDARTTAHLWLYLQKTAPAKV